MEILADIAWWVYVLFLWLFYISFKRCYVRVLKWQRLMIAPVLFLIISIHGLFKSSLHITEYSVGFWLLGALFGIATGILNVSDALVKADHENKLIEIPGDWTMLALIMAIFVVEFGVHMLIDAGNRVVQLHWFIAGIAAFSGFITGMVCGRSGMYVKKYFSAPHTEF